MGQSVKNRECPAKFGMVGTYVIHTHKHAYLHTHTLTHTHSHTHLYTHTHVYTSLRLNIIHNSPVPHRSYTLIIVSMLHKQGGGGGGGECSLKVVKGG